MMQKLVNPSIAIIDRLRMIKNGLALVILCSLGCTHNLWKPSRDFPLISIYSLAIPVWAAYTVLGILLASLLMVCLFRFARFFIALSAICFSALLLFDSSRVQYWSLFYVLFLFLLSGYNWRIDKPQRYISVFTALQVVLAGMYVLSALQSVQTGFIDSWISYIKPLEKICSPEQIRYLVWIGYLSSVLQLFIAVALFFGRSKKSAILLAYFVHLFSLFMLCLNGITGHAAIIIWHTSMLFFIYLLFAGKTKQQQVYRFSFNLYSVFILACGTAWFYTEKNMLPVTSINLLQDNKQSQYVYFDAELKNRLPLYVQFFSEKDTPQAGLEKLNISRWASHEMGISPVFSGQQLFIIGRALSSAIESENAFATQPLPPANKHALAFR